MKAEMDWPIFIGGVLLTLWLGFSVATICTVYELRHTHQTIGALEGENKVLYNLLADYETQLGLKKGRVRAHEKVKPLPQSKNKKSDALSNE